jgi:hypothetical protein
MKFINRLFKPASMLKLSVVLIVATTHAQSASGVTAVVGDLQNQFDVIGSLPPDYGWAQEFTIASGTWDIETAMVYVGNQYPGEPSVPVVQIRNSASSGNIPGLTIIGTFTMDPIAIPARIFGINNMAAVAAPADYTIDLGPGTYWLCMLNNATPASYGEINVGFADASPLKQAGAGGNIVNLADLATYDGQTFTSLNPSVPNSTLLVELDGEPVPEPSSMMLVALGATGLFIFGRKTVRS